ncbi:MAG: HNH endonuclease [Gammaproteobacteria bacterium]|nr:HNH endonuclease [Gammaproteobacteria bacterium]
MSQDIYKRFWSKVKIGLPEDCWEWQANLGRGYGMFWFGKVPMVAHRISWMMLREPIPDEMNVLHKCDNRKCVNPNHLFIGTQSDNFRDMLEKGRGGDYRNGLTLRFTKEESDDILNRYHSGESLRNIAIDYNTTHSTLIRAMKDGRIFENV